MRSKPTISYADDAHMTSCKFCCAEIHVRARVCPLCSRNQTLFGAAKGFVVTSFSIVTALASLGFAAIEKMEKLGISTELASVSANLKFEEAKSEAATQAVDQLASDIPAEVLEECYHRHFGELPSLNRLDEIESRLSNEKIKSTISREEMLQLQKQRLWLKKMPGHGHANASGNGHSNGNGKANGKPVDQAMFYGQRRNQPTAGQKHSAQRPDAVRRTSGEGAVIE